MTFITISRQFWSLGYPVEQLLCNQLGYRYFVKNLMLGRPQQWGKRNDGHLVEVIGAPS